MNFLLLWAFPSGDETTELSFSITTAVTILQLYSSNMMKICVFKHIETEDRKICFKICYRKLSRVFFLFELTILMLLELY